MGVVGIVAAGMLILVLWQNAFYEGVKVEPNSLTAQPGGTLLVTGQFLQGCKMYLVSKDDTVEVSYKPKVTNWERVVITNIPQELDHKTVKVKAQRFVGIVPFLTALLPYANSKSLVQIGNEVQAPAVAAVDPVEPGPYKPGTQFTVTGRNLGSSGAVLVNNLRAKASWSTDKVMVTLSSAAVAGTVLPVVVEPQDSSAIPAGSIQVATNLPPNPGPKPGRPQVLNLARSLGRPQVLNLARPLIPARSLNQAQLLTLSRSTRQSK